MSPKQSLVEGCKILDQLLIPAGFTFVQAHRGTSSGGNFASGEYVRQDRRLELHFRHSLGLVTYHLGKLSAAHEAVIRALDVYGKHSYPGFSADPIDEFNNLRNDLEHWIHVFISGSDSEVAELLNTAHRKESARPKGIQALP